MRRPVLPFDLVDVAVLAIGAGLVWYSYQPAGGFVHAIAGITMLGAGALFVMGVCKT